MTRMGLAATKAGPMSRDGSCHVLPACASSMPVSATLDWLVRETPGVRAGRLGVRKGTRPDYFVGFVYLARKVAF